MVTESTTQRIWTTQMAEHVGERVLLQGWLHRFRRLGGIAFLVLRDAKGLSQVVIEEPEVIELLAGLYNESVLSVVGAVTAEAQAPGGIEIRQPTIEVVSAAAEPPPFDLFRPQLQAQLPTLLDYAALTLRHPQHRALFEIASASMAGFRSALRSREFVEIQTPKIVAEATESGANVFSIDYFGRQAYLAQSPQFYKQMMVGVFERVFEVGPVFRAEPHDTPRHLNEFVSLDAEMGFIEDHFTVMEMLTEVIRDMVQAVHEQAPNAVSLVGVSLPEVPTAIPAVHFAEAMAMIGRDTGVDLSREPDLAPEHERWLGEWASRQYGSDFLFVTGYPMTKRPFYTHPEPGNSQFSNSFDLLFRGMELVTGGQRLHRYTDYLAALQERGMSPEPFEGYLQAFKFGMPPHGGFAIGLERWVARLVGLDNVKQTTLFPRDMHRLTP